MILQRNDVIKSFLILLILITTIFSTPDEIAEYLKLPEDSIDFGRAALILSKDAFPDIDPDVGAGFFDYVADRVSQFLAMANPADTQSLEVKRIGSLNTFLYREGGWNRVKENDYVTYEYDLEFEQGEKWEALFLPSMIYERKGTCATMPVFWYIIADRLDWPVNLVVIPGHIFVKYDDFEYGNIDATVQGGYIPDSRFITDAQIPERAIEQGAYLRPLSKKEAISALIVNNAFYAITVNNDTTTAIDYYKIAVEYDSLNANAIAGLGLLTNNRELIQRAVELGVTDNTYSNEFYRKRSEQDQNE